MVVYGIKRHVVPRMQLVQKQDRQGPPGHESMPGVSGKSQEKKEPGLEENSRQKEGACRTSKRQTLKIRTTPQLCRALRRSHHGRGLGRGSGQGLGRNTTRLPMHLSRPETGRGRRWRGHHSQPQGAATDHCTATDHGRSKDMDDISPNRIPAGKGRGRSHQQQRRTNGETHSTIPSPSHLRVHCGLGGRAHLDRDTTPPR